MKLLPNINDLIQNKIKNLGPNYVAIHVRRTDFKKLIDKGFVEYTDDSIFYNFIDKNKNKNIYLSTDNYNTQKKYIDIFKNKIKYNKLLDIKYKKK